MKGEVSAETPVRAPASAVWEVYGGPQLWKVVDELLGDVLGKVDVEEGDGSVGTIVKLTFPPGTPGCGYMKEKFITIDNEKRVKVTEVIEGGLTELDFDKINIKLEIIEKPDDAKSSIIKSTLLYEIEDSKFEAASPHISVKLLEIMAETVGKYIQEKHA